MSDKSQAMAARPTTPRSSSSEPTGRRWVSCGIFGPPRKASNRGGDRKAAAGGHRTVACLNCSPGSGHRRAADLSEIAAFVRTR
jgi:hypothetical protein